MGFSCDVFPYKAESGVPRRSTFGISECSAPRSIRLAGLWFRCLSEQPTADSGWFFLKNITSENITIFLYLVNGWQVDNFLIYVIN